MRVRWDNYQDTPYPVETPAGQNPPDGAILDYFLKNAATTARSTLTIYDDKGAEVAQVLQRCEARGTILPANVPEYWFAPPTALPKAAGVNRFAWDLRYPAPLTLALRLLRQSAGVHRIHAGRPCHRRPHAA